jgi:hypothetical protein
MNKLILTLGISFLSLGVSALETSEKIIERIQIQGNASGGIPFYYFFNSSGWGSSGCENAVYAYMKATDVGAKEMLSLAIASKATRTKVKFAGKCRPGQAAYFQIDYMYQM